MALGQCLQVRHEPFAHGDGLGQQPLVLDDPHVLDGGDGTRGAAAEGRDVAEIAHAVLGRVLEHLEDALGRHRAGDRRIARGQALGHGDEIGLDAMVLIAEPGAGLRWCQTWARSAATTPDRPFGVSVCCRGRSRVLEVAKAGQGGRRDGRPSCSCRPRQGRQKGSNHSGEQGGQARAPASRTDHHGSRLPSKISANACFWQIFHFLRAVSSS